MTNFNPAYPFYNFDNPSAPAASVLSPPNPLYPPLSGFSPPPINTSYPFLYGFSQPQSYVPVVPKPQLTQAIHDQTSSLLSKAYELSGSILYGKMKNPPPYNPQAMQSVVASKSKTPTVKFDFSDRSWKMFNSETHVHHHYHNGEENKKDDDTGTRLLVGLIGLTVALVAAFFVGKAVADNEEAGEEKGDFEDLKTRWNINKVYYDADYQMTVDGVIKKTEVLLHRKQTNRTHKIALFVFGFIGGGVAFAGALIGSTPLMLTAAAVGGVVGVLAIFKLGYSCFSKRDQKDAQAINNGLSELAQKNLLIVG